MPPRPLRNLYHFSKLVKQLQVCKTEAALALKLLIRLTRTSMWCIFVIRASDAVLPTFDTMRRSLGSLIFRRGSHFCSKITPYPLIYKKSGEPRH